MIKNYSNIIKYRKRNGEIVELNAEEAEEKGEDTTNVYRLCNTLIKDENQIVKYLKGVGTSGWKIWDLKGDLYGLGATSIREEAQEFFRTRYEPGDKVFVYGFSRGAAIARDFANVINNDKGTGQERSVRIELLGLWDTVAAFGIPVDIVGLPTGEINLGKKLDVPSNVSKIYHLLSIDEQRTPFIPTLVEAASNVEEVWFSGVHADVGGGYDCRRLSDISLRFMIGRSIANSLRFDQSKVASIPKNPNGEGEIHNNQGKFPLGLREIVVRYNGKSSNAKPKIHKTVFARMKNQEYKPKNLIDLGSNYEMVE
jgi:uncharacterized protein (DUF2235 family)